MTRSTAGLRELKDYLTFVQANGCQSVLGVKPYGGGCDCQQGKGAWLQSRSCFLRRRIGFARRISKSAAVSGGDWLWTAERA